ncbi:hypothetical protein EVG20_g9992 [Dentipellis fragilis]|uniref:Uncharacterized protein n=1 Tax=Dentipellis fragilis TaxID=205917 RepID=A0A4Y9XWH4_9AGAM|nr:hypothetical protein EVG20_g9992 [Dentipellis fragilis]
MRTAPPRQRLPAAAPSLATRTHARTHLHQPTFSHARVDDAIAIETARERAAATAGASLMQHVQRVAAPPTTDVSPSIYLVASSPLPHQCSIYAPWPAPLRSARKSLRPRHHTPPRVLPLHRPHSLCCCLMPRSHCLRAPSAQSVPSRQRQPNRAARVVSSLPSVRSAPSPSLTRSVPASFPRAAVPSHSRSRAHRHRHRPPVLSNRPSACKLAALAAGCTSAARARADPTAPGRRTRTNARATPRRHRRPRWTTVRRCCSMSYDAAAPTPMTPTFHLQAQPRARDAHHRTHLHSHTRTSARSSASTSLAPRPSLPRFRLALLLLGPASTAPTDPPCPSSHSPRLAHLRLHPHAPSHAPASPAFASTLTRHRLSPPPHLPPPSCATHAPFLPRSPPVLSRLQPAFSRDALCACTVVPPAGSVLICDPAAGSISTRQPVAAVAGRATGNHEAALPPCTTPVTRSPSARASPLPLAPSPSPNAALMLPSTAYSDLLLDTRAHELLKHAIGHAIVRHVQDKLHRQPAWCAQPRRADEVENEVRAVERIDREAVGGVQQPDAFGTGDAAFDGGRARGQLEMLRDLDERGAVQEAVGEPHHALASPPPSCAGAIAVMRALPLASLPRLRKGPPFTGACCALSPICARAPSPSCVRSLGDCQRNPSRAPPQTIVLPSFLSCGLKGQGCICAYGISFVCAIALAHCGGGSGSMG